MSSAPRQQVSLSLAMLDTTIYHQEDYLRPGLFRRSVLGARHGIGDADKISWGPQKPEEVDRIRPATISVSPPESTTLVLV